MNACVTILMVGEAPSLEGLFPADLPLTARRVERVRNFKEAERRLTRSRYSAIVCHEDAYAEGGECFLTRVAGDFAHVPCVFVSNPIEAASICALVQRPTAPDGPITGEPISSGRALRARIAALVETVDTRDPQNVDHSPQVAAMSVRLGRAIGMDEGRLTALELAGLGHDVGKIGVPAEVLSKPGNLSGVQWSLVRRHPALGADLLVRMGAGAEVARIVRHHHERFDGRGYPDGLAEESIPLESRIVGLVDAYVAMTANRSYRPALAPSAAKDLIARGLGGHFDRALGEVFLGMCTPA